MFSEAETSMWQALRLFDTNHNLSPREFSSLLESDGWVQPQHPGTAEIFIKEDFNLVFKIDDKSLFNDGYSKFAKRMRQPDITIETHPVFPRIYRYRENITLLERLNSTEETKVREWVNNVKEIVWLIKGALEVQGDEIAGPFTTANPKLESSLRILCETAEATEVSIYCHDVLQRNDGTFVLIDPVF